MLIGGNSHYGQLLHCRFVGDNEGNLQGFDARQKQLTQAALNIHDRKINTVNVSMAACLCPPMYVTQTESLAVVLGQLQYPAVIRCYM